jgi:hypothetical protein
LPHYAAGENPSLNPQPSQEFPEPIAQMRLLEAYEIAAHFEVLLLFGQKLARVVD